MRVTCLACGQANRVPAERLSAAKCGICGQRLISSRPVEVDAATLAKAVRDDLPLLVDFWAPWCGPCRQMAPHYAQAAGQLAPQLRAVKIDTQAHPKASQSHRIQGIPAFLLFRSGREIARAAGVQPASALVAWAQGALGARG